MKALSQNGLSIHGSSRLLIKGVMSTVLVWSGDFPRPRLLYHRFLGKESDRAASLSLSSQFCACFLVQEFPFVRKAGQIGGPWRAARDTPEFLGWPRPSVLRLKSSCGLRNDRIAERPLPKRVSAAQPRYSSVDDNGVAEMVRPERIFLQRCSRHDV